MNEFIVISVIGVALTLLIAFLLPLKTIRLIGFQEAGKEHEELIATEPLTYVYGACWYLLCW